MKKSKGSENYQLLYKHLVGTLLDDLKTQSETSLRIISEHLSTVSGIIKMRFRKGSKEHTTAVKAYNEGLKALKDVEEALRVLDNVLKTLYRRKKV